MRRPRLTDHARGQCATRDLPADLVEDLAADGVRDAEDGRHVAVVVGTVEDRGALVGSNGSLVVAVVRDGRVSTIMLRREDQPLTAAALDVDQVVDLVGLSGPGR